MRLVPLLPDILICITRVYLQLFNFLHQEEEEKKIREEKERQEHEEYLKMKEFFSVEDEGQDDVEPDLNVSSNVKLWLHNRKDPLVKTVFSSHSVILTIYL